MKPSFLLPVVGALLAFSLQAHAVDSKPIDPNATSNQALVSGSASAPSPFVVQSTGFEPGEGFAPGYAGGQAGWTTFAASTAQPVINATAPISGTQDLQIDEDTAVAAGTLTGGFSPLLGPQDVTKPSSASVDVLITGAGGADYDVAPQAPSQGALTARVNFSFLGNINVLDGGAFVDTGVTWPVGTSFNLRIDVDPVAATIDYFIDGSPIYSASALVNGTQIEQVVLLSDNFHFGEVGQFDNLVIDTDTSGAPYVAPRELPLLGNLGLLLLGLLLAGTSLVAIRR